MYRRIGLGMGNHPARNGFEHPYSLSGSAANMNRSDLGNRSEARAATSGVTASPTRCGISLLSATKKIAPSTGSSAAPCPLPSPLATFLPRELLSKRLWFFETRHQERLDGKPMRAELTLRGITLMDKVHRAVTSE
jgi:hypothetical protein